MTETIKTDVCVIGAGSGGLSVAAGASQMGAKVVLIERAKMGGDCLNYGCVPSKALIAAGHMAQSARRGRVFGVNGQAPDVRFGEVHDHVHGVIATIAPHDSQERFEGLGVDVIRDTARFVDERTVEAGGKRIQARRFVVATGSRPAEPDIPGLARLPYLTNETIFDLTERPEHLIILGGGPIGCEMAQAHGRLGARVTVLQRDRIMPKDDPEAVEVVRKRFIEEGVDVRENVTVKAAAPCMNGIAVMVEDGGEEMRIEGSHLLVSAGRVASVDGLNLEAAGIAYTAKGIRVDSRLRTSNKRVFAIGDAAGGYQFTHMAAYHAGIVIRNALFHWPAQVKYHAVPWVTYTDPELAQVGLTEAQAVGKYGSKTRVTRWSFAENDRAQAERDTSGLIKVVTGPGARIVGATIVGPHAGEMITTWILAVNEGLKIGAIANLIVPYPTLGEVSKRAAGAYYTDTLFSSRTRRLVSLLQKLP